jgi:hypothetical protein
MKFRNASRIAICLAWMCLSTFGLSLVYGGESEEILKAAPDHYDFGTIDEGQPAAVTAVVQNVGSAPVEITNVKTS